MAANLEAIRAKVRRLTRSLSPSLLTTEQIDDYINTFVLYTFPEQLRLLNLKETFSFYTQPYVDVYETSDDPNSVLYNFKNKYITVSQPFFVAGYQVAFFEDRNQFFSVYPQTNSIASIGQTGDGAATTFSGVINSQQSNLPPNFVNNSPVLIRDNVLFESIDASGEGMSIIDYPVSNTKGALGLPGQPTTLPSPYGQINYVTGEFTVVFPNPPASGVAINSQTIPRVPARPQAILFYDGTFTLRPVPDKAYKIEMDAFVRPTELLASADEPKLQEWWEYISFGAAIKVFEDRMDLESINLMMPRFKEYERLVQRRTIVQQTSQRASTIYADQYGQTGSGWNWGNNGGIW